VSLSWNLHYIGANHPALLGALPGADIAAWNIIRQRVSREIIRRECVLLTNLRKVMKRQRASLYFGEYICTPEERERAVREKHKSARRHGRKKTQRIIIFMYKGAKTHLRVYGQNLRNCVNHLSPPARPCCHCAAAWLNGGMSSRITPLLPLPRALSP
jgi:hypothetical protein